MLRIAPLRIASRFFLTIFPLIWQAGSSNTLLHKAVIKSDVALVSYLCEVGCSVTAKNAMNDSPVEVAFRGRNEEVRG